jgi:hypothetical protein
MERNGSQNLALQRFTAFLFSSAALVGKTRKALRRAGGARSYCSSFGWEMFSSGYTIVNRYRCTVLCYTDNLYTAAAAAAATSSSSSKVKVKVKFTPEQVTKAQRWRRGMSLLFL